MSEAEQALVGAAILDPRAYDEAADVVSVEDFAVAAHRTIWSAVSELVAQGTTPDIVTVHQRVQERGEGDAATLRYIGELSRSTPSAANARSYARIVQRESIRRSVARTASQIAERAQGADDPLQLLGDAQGEILAIGEQRSGGPERVASRLGSWLDRVEQRGQQSGGITGVASGYHDLDRLTAGLQPSDLIVVAARPSQGKTTAALNIAEHVAVRGGGGVAVFSLEMDRESLLDRLHASVASVPLDSIRRGQLEPGEWDQLSEAQDRLLGAPLWLDDEPALRHTDIAARCRRLHRQHGLSLVVIDYLQLMTPPRSESRNRELEEITHALKGLAKELEVPVVVLSQLNRSLEQRQNKRPIMSDLRDSGGIEQDADVIAFLYRDESYHANSQHPGIAELIVAKQRQGRTGEIPLAWQGEYARMRSLSAEDRDAFYERRKAEQQSKGKGKKKSGGLMDDVEGVAI